MHARTRTSDISIQASTMWIVMSGLGLAGFISLGIPVTFGPAISGRRPPPQPRRAETT